MGSKWGRCNLCNSEIGIGDLRRSGKPYYNPDNDNPICYRCYLGVRFPEMNSQRALDLEVEWRKKVERGKV